MITVVHMQFKKSKRELHLHTKFPSFLYPVSNYLCLIFLVGILVLMWITGMKLPVALIPIWVAFLFVCYLLVKRNKQQAA
jgi:aromatic amino acid transport protein AroP